MAGVAVHPVAGFVELAPLVIVGIDLTALMVALMVILVACAGWVILWILHIALGRISIFGFHPFDFFFNLATDAIVSLWGQLVKRVPAFGHFLWSLVMQVWRPLYVIGATLAGLLTQIVGVSQASQKGLATLQAREDFFIGQLRNQEQTDIANLGLSVLSIEAQLQAKEAADVAALNGTIARDIGSLSTRLNADVGALTNDINGVRINLTNALNSDVLNLNNRITSVDTQLSATINRDVQDLTRADVTTLRTAENFATGLVSGLGIGSIRQTLTSLQSQVSQIKTETTECLDPLCNTVTPQAKRLGNLGKWLGDLEALAAAALLIAIAEEARTDPAGVAHDIEAVVQGVGSDVFQGFKDIIGL